MKSDSNAPEKKFMEEAIQLSIDNLNSNTGGPFGAVVVKDGVIIGRGSNRVTSTNDPTAHAEVVAIREACQHLNSFQLDDCILYTSCEPCPMCLGAIYWARPKKIFYACNREDAAAINFDDAMIYHEINAPLADRIIPMERLMHEEGLVAFKLWKEKVDKVEY